MSMEVNPKPYVRWCPGRWNEKMKERRKGRERGEERGKEKERERRKRQREIQERVCVGVWVGGWGDSETKRQRERKRGGRKEEGRKVQLGWKEPASKAADSGSIPGWGRSPGEGKGHPLQYSGLENSMDCVVHGVAKSRTLLSDFHFHFSHEIPVCVYTLISAWS